MDVVALKLRLGKHAVMIPGPGGILAAAPCVYLLRQRIYSDFRTEVDGRI